MNIHGKYVGAIENLAGKTAMILKGETGQVKAQFDDLSLGTAFTHNWVVLPASDSMFDPPVDFQE